MSETREGEIGAMCVWVMEAVGRETVTVSSCLASAGCQRHRPSRETHTLAH